MRTVGILSAIEKDTPCKRGWVHIRDQTSEAVARRARVSAFPVDAGTSALEAPALPQSTHSGGGIHSASRPYCFKRVRSRVRLSPNNLAARDLLPCA
jgi:hypothetical protein